MSVTLRKRKNSDGTTTLFLDIYLRGKRTYDFLPECKLKKASTPEDRKYNQEMLKVAQEIQGKRLQQHAKGLIHKSSITAINWLTTFVDSYTKSDIRNYKGVSVKFKSFLQSKGLSGLLLRDLTETLCIEFKDSLAKGSVGEGAASYYVRFKRMIKQAAREKIIETNPCAEIKLPRGKARIKNTLSIEEIQAIANADTKSPDIKLGFLFACMPGLRHVDIRKLTWDNIDLDSAVMKITQSKTGEEVVIQLNASAIAILDKTERREGRVFVVSKSGSSHESLTALVKRAGIKKKISWHCARHTFGTNLIYYGADVYSTSKLLGHTSVKHTQRYVRAAEDLKQQAVNKLPEIKL